jgi:5-methyltetrahydropteroyltriglutamate--homocysteine methyltransferase
MTNASISTSTLGFARMGPRRELKFALEKHWKGSLSLEALLEVANQVESSAWDLHIQAGIDKVTVGDHYLYDGILTWTEFLGVVPTRFETMNAGASRMFAMARGVDGAPALSK